MKSASHSLVNNKCGGGGLIVGRSHDNKKCGDCSDVIERCGIVGRCGVNIVIARGYSGIGVNTCCTSTIADKCGGDGGIARRCSGDDIITHMCGWDNVIA